jgi:hypothetical protein
VGVDRFAFTSLSQSILFTSGTSPLGSKDVRNNEGNAQGSRWRNGCRTGPTGQAFLGANAWPVGPKTSRASPCTLGVALVVTHKLTDEIARGVYAPFPPKAVLGPAFTPGKGGKLGYALSAPFTGLLFVPTKGAKARRNQKARKRASGQEK